MITRSHPRQLVVFWNKSVKSKQFSDTSTFFQNQDPEDLEKSSKVSYWRHFEKKDFNKFRTTLKYSEVNQWKNILIQFSKFNNKGLIPSRKTCRVSKQSEIRYLENLLEIDKLFLKKWKLKEI